MTLSTKRASMRIKADTIGADGSFSGYGSVFNVVDTGGDIVLPGAFAESLVERKASGDFPRMLLEHDPAKPIGIWDEMAEDDHGLLCKGRLLLDVQAAREVYALMKGGHPYGLSIGFEMLDSAWIAAGDVQKKYGFTPPTQGYATHNGQYRTVAKVDLWETSVVTFPMNTAARVDDVKSTQAPVDTASIAALSRALERRNAVLRRVCI